MTAAELRLWPGRAVYVGPGLRAAEHAHHAMQIVVALDGGDIGVRAGKGWSRWPGLRIGPSRPHEVDAVGATVVTVWTENDAFDRGAPTPERLDVDAWGLLAGLDAAITGRDLDAAVADALGLPDRRSLPDPRVDAARRAIVADIRYGITTDLGALAHHVDLSPRRLRQLFSAEEGIPLQRYRLWQRLFRALHVAGAGRSLTEAAHTAGFADQAHLTRTFRASFGFAPRDVFGSRNVQVTVHDRP